MKFSSRPVLPIADTTSSKRWHRLVDGLCARLMPVCAADVCLPVYFVLSRRAPFAITTAARSRREADASMPTCRKNLPHRVNDKSGQSDASCSPAQRASDYRASDASISGYFD